VVYYFSFADKSLHLPTTCFQGGSVTRPTPPYRDGPENYIMYLCTPQVVGKPDIGIEFTDRIALYHALHIVILDKYELYIQKPEIISIDGIHIKLPTPRIG
jgi:hypothetical protein